MASLNKLITLGLACGINGHSLLNASGESCTYINDLSNMVKKIDELVEVLYAIKKTIGYGNISYKQEEDLFRFMSNCVNFEIDQLEDYMTGMNDYFLQELSKHSSH